MKDLNIQKEIEQIKKVSLTVGEKYKMLHNLSMYADMHMSVPSPFSIFSFLKIPAVRKFSYAIASVLIAVLVGGTAAYASENSLPGDMLYGIKTKIVEPLRAVMAKTPEEKAKIETELADTRLKEAEDLEKLGKLTPEFKANINENLNSHLSRYNEIKGEIEKDNSTSSVDKIDGLQKDYEERITKHKDMLNRFNKDMHGFDKTDSKESGKIKKPEIDTKGQGSRSHELEKLNEDRNPERTTRENATNTEN